MLSTGSSGDEVTQLQEDLAKLGFDPGPVDGIFGGKTAAAVKAFQESVDALAVDGIAGPKTLASLKARVNADSGWSLGGSTPSAPAEPDDTASTGGSSPV